MSQIVMERKLHIGSQTLPVRNFIDVEFDFIIYVAAKTSIEDSMKVRIV